MKDVLGITPREVQDSLVEMGQTMIEKGLVVKKVKKSKVCLVFCCIGETIIEYYTLDYIGDFVNTSLKWN